MTYPFKDFNPVLKYLLLEQSCASLNLSSGKKSHLLNVCNCIPRGEFLMLSSWSSPRWWQPYYEHGNMKPQNFKCKHAHDTISYVLKFWKACFQMSRIC